MKGSGSLVWGRPAQGDEAAVTYGERAEVARGDQVIAEHKTGNRTVVGLLGESEGYGSVVERSVAGEPDTFLVAFTSKRAIVSNLHAWCELPVVALALQFHRLGGAPR